MTQANAKTQSKTLRRLIAAAVFAAMTCALTAAFPIPMFNGYFNLGDTIVLIGHILNGDKLKTACRKAMDAVYKLIDLNKANTDKNQGIPLERYLDII